MVELRLKDHIDEKRYNKEHALIMGQNEGYKVKIKNLNNDIDDFNNKSNKVNLGSHWFVAKDKEHIVKTYLDKIILHKIKTVKITKKQVETLEL